MKNDLIHLACRTNLKNIRGQEMFISEYTPDCKYEVIRADLRKLGIETTYDPVTFKQLAAVTDLKYAVYHTAQHKLRNDIWMHYVLDCASRVLVPEEQMEMDGKQINVKLIKDKCIKDAIYAAHFDINKECSGYELEDILYDVCILCNKSIGTTVNKDWMPYIRYNVTLNDGLRDRIFSDLFRMNCHWGYAAWIVKEAASLPIIGDYIPYDMWNRVIIPVRHFVRLIAYKSGLGDEGANAAEEAEIAWQTERLIFLTEQGFWTPVEGGVS